MKKMLSMFLIFCMMLIFAAGCSAQPLEHANTNASVISLQVGNPLMMVDGIEQEIDPGRGTTPIIDNDRTLLPIRAVVEAMGGTVAWEETTQTAVLSKGDTVIELIIGSHIAFINGTAQTLDIPPTVINDRTMLPIRFVAESFEYAVEWEEDAQTIILTPATIAQEESDMTNQPIAANPQEQNTKSSLVVYFSQTGNTKALALRIAEVTDSDVYELVPQVPYTDADLDYRNDNSRANQEQNDESARPAIAGDPIDLSNYETIYLGYPIWWGTIPRIIQTFMDQNDLFGKTIMPFCTSQSTGISNSVSAIKSYCPGAEVKDGLRGSGQISEDEIRRWLTDNGI